MKDHQVAGIVLISTSLGFVAVFGYLAANFGYPAVLDGSAGDVLPALLAGGSRMRWVWAVYAALPAGVALAAILAFPLLRAGGATVARVGVVAAVVSACAMSAGLMRWPTLHHALAQRFAVAGAEERELLSTLFDAANLYLGNVTGEFVGEVMLSTWLATSGVAIVRGVGLWRPLGHVGLVVAFSMTIGAFRNLTALVAPVAALNDNLLPLWLVALGVALARGGGVGIRDQAIAVNAGSPLRARGRRSSSARAHPS